MNGGLPMLVDGHMHLENGPLTKEYVMEFINEAYKQGFDLYSNFRSYTSF